MKAFEKDFVRHCVTVAITNDGLEMKAVGKGETFASRNTDCVYTVDKNNGVHRSEIYHKQGKMAYIKVNGKQYFVSDFRKLF